MQTAIEAAELGDMGPLEELHEVLERPFDEQPESDHLDDAGKSASQLEGVWQLSCSS